MTACYTITLYDLILNAVKRALLLDVDDTRSGKVSVLDACLLSVKREENIKCMMTKVQCSNTLDVLDEVRPLASISGQLATPEQQIDLLGFWEMGHEKGGTTVLSKYKSGLIGTDVKISGLSRQNRDGWQL